MSWIAQAKAALSHGKMVRVNPKGNSMVPRIYSGDTVELVPIFDDTVLLVDDIVLVKVAGNTYLHAIRAINGYRYQIANNSGHVNGWANRSAIYGKVTEIWRR